MAYLRNPALLYLVLTTGCLIGAPLLIQHTEAKLQGLEDRMEKRNQFPSGLHRSNRP